jgi:hypothetical protein
MTGTPMGGWSTRGLSSREEREEQARKARVVREATTSARRNGTRTRGTCPEDVPSPGFLISSSSRFMTLEEAG